MPKKILVVEDEYSINEIVTFALRKEGYEVESVFDQCTALLKLETFHPDLVLLDAMLPDGDGFEICKSISSRYHVIMLTAKDSMFDKILGMELGADDYMTKPFEIREVVVRVKALFRTLDKAKEGKCEKVALTPLIQVDVEGQRIYLQEEEIKLKRKEWELFEYLLKHRGRVFTREELLDKVWGYDYIGDSRTVDVHIRRIRGQLGLEKDDVIETVFGTGYVMRV
ncbi:MAG: response regulator transcription factor [Cellulosilyticaceae bacterium]